MQPPCHVTDQASNPPLCPLPDGDGPRSAAPTHELAESAKGMGSTSVTEPGAKYTPLSKSGSTFLDVVRFGTAMIVFLGHLGPFFPWADRLAHLAHIAVCVFFVLSGFVIRMVVSARIGTMGSFFVDRASRIYSVVLPALVVTLLCQVITRLVNPAGFAAVPEPVLWHQVPLYWFTNLTFTAQSWGYDTLPPWNSPFWSLSFECVYYVLFALFFYRPRTTSRWLLIALTVLISGPAIVLLFPTWLLGCLLYDVYRWLGRRRNALLLSSAALAAVLALGFFFRPAIDHLLVLTDAAHRTAWLQHFFSPAWQARLADKSGFVPWVSRLSFSFYPCAILIFVLVLWVLLALDRLAPNAPRRLASSLRWIAEGTFSLYLLHLPLLWMIAALLHRPPRHPALWSGAVLLFCIVVAQPFDRFKIYIRQHSNAFRSGLRAGQPTPAA